MHAYAWQGVSPPADSALPCSDAVSLIKSGADKVLAACCDLLKLTFLAICSRSTWEDHHIQVCTVLNVTEAERVHVEHCAPLPFGAVQT